MASSLAAMPHGRESAGRRACFACLAWLATLGGVSGPSAAAPEPAEAVFTHPTYSSPIALSADNRLPLERQPERRQRLDRAHRPRHGGAEAPGRQRAAERGAGPEQRLRLRRQRRREQRQRHPHPATTSCPASTPGSCGPIRTGAEPWNVVISPDGKRVFVANSGQDTITVINALNRQVIGQIDLRKSKCNVPDPRRHFQPRGMAVTLDNRQLLRDPLPVLRQGGRQAGRGRRQGGRGLPPAASTPPPPRSAVTGRPG